MKLLALDTAGGPCGVALLVDGRLAAEAARGGDRSHARQVMPLVAEVLARGGLGPADLDLVGVTRGPGSFTGVRIGLATAQGLALAAGCRVTAVSSLEVLALQAGEGPDPVAVLVDARRGEVYAGVFRVEPSGPVPLAPERVAPPEAAAARIPVPCRLVGSGAVLYADRLQRRLGPGARIVPDDRHAPRAATVARLALARRGTAVPPDRLEPVYLRLSDAERNRQGVVDKHARNC